MSNYEERFNMETGEINELNARVAALMYDINVFSSLQTDAARDMVERAIRAELQKPALHEPVTDAEVYSALNTSSSNYGPHSVANMRYCLESFLQGRAQPAQEEITDAERRLEISGYELQQERFKAEQYFKILMEIYNLLNPELMKLEDGRSMHFINPYANEILDLLSKRIRAISDDVNNAAIRASKGKKP